MLQWTLVFHFRTLSVWIKNPSISELSMWILQLTSLLVENVLHCSVKIFIKFKLELHGARCMDIPESINACV